MQEEEFKDEICERILALESLVKRYERLVSRINGKIRQLENPSTKDFQFFQNMQEQFEKTLKEEAIALLHSAKKDKDFFYDILVTKKDISDEALEWIYPAISKSPEEWSNLIVALMTQLIDSTKGGNNENLKLFYALTNNLPQKYFPEESEFIQRLTAELDNRSVKVLYWVKYVLWQQDYTYPKVLQGFQKNISHWDWRIRILTNEYLRTWKREYQLDDINVPYISISDKIRRLFYKNFELDLLS